MRSGGCHDPVKGEGRRLVYRGGFEAARPILRQLRRIITTAVPEAEETISYGMPFYRYHGRLAYFAAHKDKHHFTGRFTSCPAARSCPASA